MGLLAGQLRHRTAIAVIAITTAEPIAATGSARRLRLSGTSGGNRLLIAGHGSAMRGAVRLAAGSEVSPDNVRVVPIFVHHAGRAAHLHRRLVLPDFGRLFFGGQPFRNSPRENVYTLYIGRSTGTVGARKCNFAGTIM